MVDENLADIETIDLDVIRALHESDPETVERLMLDNDRVVFFEVIPADRWPRASTGVRLIPRHSVAVDPEVIPLGSVVMIEDLAGACSLRSRGRHRRRHQGPPNRSLSRRGRCGRSRKPGRLIDSVRISIIEPALED